MKQTYRSFFLLCTIPLLGACDLGTMGKQWLDPDKTFAALDQPQVDSINETTEKMAKEAEAAEDFVRAGQFYKQLVDSKKGSKTDQYRYKIGLANAARRAGVYDQALAMFETLIQENPKDLEAAEGKGLCLMALGKQVDAGRVFAEIVKTDKTRWRTMNALGILFVTKNMIPEANAYYTEALRLSADNPSVLNNVGLSYAIDHQFPRAFDAFDQALRVAKNETQRKQITLNSAMVYAISGDLDNARAVAGRYLQGPALDNNMGLYAHLAKDDQLAKTYLDMALSGSDVFYQRAWENMDVVNQTKDR